MAGDLGGSKSTSGIVITFVGGAVSWQSKLQKCDLWNLWCSLLMDAAI